MTDQKTLAQGTLQSKVARWIAAFPDGFAMFLTGPSSPVTPCFGWMWACHVGPPCCAPLQGAPELLKYAVEEALHVFGVQQIL